MPILHPRLRAAQAVTLSVVIALLYTTAWALAASAADSPPVELPDGPAAVAWAGVGAETEPAPIGGDWLVERARDAGGTGEPVTDRWLAWASWLAAEAAAGRAGEDADPRRRAALALVALEQRRWNDAWHHFARLSAHPELAAGLMPRCLPGVPAGAGVLPGGLPAPLADGVVLRPAPPPPPAGPARLGETRRAAAHGLRIGTAWVDMAVLVEPAGVEITLTHVGGGPARFAVRLPQPAGRRIGIEYADWFRQDTLGEPLAVELVPGCEPVTLFGRFVPFDRDLPASPGADLPAGLKGGGLWIEVGGACEALRLEAGAAAAAVGELLAIPAGLRDPRSVPAAGPFSGTVVHLADPARARSVLAALASAAEAHVLHGVAGGVR